MGPIAVLQKQSSLGCHHRWQLYKDGRSEKYLISGSKEATEISVEEDREGNSRLGIVGRPSREAGWRGLS